MMFFIKKNYIYASLLFKSALGVLVVLAPSFFMHPEGYGVYVKNLAAIIIISAVIDFGLPGYLAATDLINTNYFGNFLRRKKIIFIFAIVFFVIDFLFGYSGGIFSAWISAVAISGLNIKFGLMRNEKKNKVESIFSLLSLVLYAFFLSLFFLVNRAIENEYGQQENNFYVPVFFLVTIALPRFICCIVYDLTCCSERTKNNSKKYNGSVNNFWGHGILIGVSGNIDIWVAGTILSPKDLGDIRIFMVILSLQLMILEFHAQAWQAKLVGFSIENELFDVARKSAKNILLFTTVLVSMALFVHWLLISISDSESLFLLMTIVASGFFRGLNTLEGVILAVTGRQKIRFRISLVINILSVVCVAVACRLLGASGFFIATLISAVVQFCIYKYFRQ